MAGYEIFKASLGFLDFEMDLRESIWSASWHRWLNWRKSTLNFTIANVQQIGFGSSCFSFVLRKGGWVISKSTEISKELKLRLDHWIWIGWKNNHLPNSIREVMVLKLLTAIQKYVLYSSTGINLFFFIAFVTHKIGFSFDYKAWHPRPTLPLEKYCFPGQV